MTDELILWEYRQMAGLARLRAGKTESEPEQMDDSGYDDYLEALRNNG